MSKQVDERVVSMEFDNKQFEQNVSTTMSTLDKLKQKLNFSGASKGLENVNTAAKNVNMNGLGNAVESVRMKFSALDVMGVTALANITNSAINAGKRIVSALTIDPIKTGFQEYETQINAVQTILANTQSKGTTLDDVNNALDTLNTYADKTIYNFTEMTRNIGTFTAAGVDLNTSVNAIQGIANLAAVSGSTSQQASTAMYQLSQALASGTVKLMDWNSVVNAGMGGQVFQDALKETARVHGIAIDQMIEEQGSFRETLSEGWLTSEILTETLQKFTLSTEGLTEAQIEQNREMLRAKGYTETQIEEIFKLGNTATNAATKVKTFTQLWDVMKEAAQSGWTQTWELIIGDFEEAKNLLTPISDFFTGENGIITKMSDARNTLLEGALGKGFSSLSEKIKGITKPASDAIDSIKETVKVVTDLGKIVDEVIIGKFGNGKDRYDALTKAGINYYEVQNKVNEKLGDSFRHSEETIAAQNKLLGIQTELNETEEDLTETQTEQIATLVKLSDAELRSLGYTEDQISAFKELRDTAEKLGLPIEEFIANLDEIDGRWLLINSLKNAAQGFITIFESIGKAWREVFPPMQSDQLFNLIAGLHKFSTYLVVSGDTAEKLTRTFKGLFAIIDIITTITGGAFKIAFKVATTILGMFHLDILDVTAAIGDAVVKFRDWIDENNILVKGIEVLVPFVQKAAKVIKDFVISVKESEKFKEFTQIAGNIIQGLANGIKNGASTVWDAIVELAENLIAKFKEVLGIHSPSTVMMAIGGFIIAGLALGILNGIPEVKEAISGVVSNIGEVFKSIDWGNIFSGGISIGLLAILKKLTDTLNTLASPFKGLGELFAGTGKVLDKSAKPIAKILKNTAKVVKSFSKIMNSVAFNMKADGIKTLAVSIAILVGAIIALTFIDINKLWNAVGIVFALAVILGILALASKKISEASISIGEGKASINGLKSGLLAIAASLLILAVVAELMSSMEGGDMVKAAAGLLGLVGVVALLVKITKTAGNDIGKTGTTLLAISGAMYILTITAKIIAGMPWGDMAKAAIGLAGLVGVVALLVHITKSADSYANKIGETLLAISRAMIILSIVAKIIAGMSWGDMAKAAIGLAGLVGVVALLVEIVKKVEKDAPKIALTLLSLSISIGILGAIAVILGIIPLKNLAKGIAAITMLGGIMTAMIWATRGANECKGNLIVMTVAIGVMSAVIAALSFIDTGKLAASTIALSSVMGMFALIIKAGSDMKSSMGTLIVMTVAIGVLCGIIYLLAGLPTESVIGVAASLSILLITLSGALFVLSQIGKQSTDALTSIILLTLMAVPLLAFVGVLAIMQNVQNALANVQALTIMAGALTLLLIPLTILGYFAISALVGILALTLMVVPLLAFVGVLALMQNIQNATENINGLIRLLTVITGVLVILAIIGPMALIGVAAMAGLMLLITAIGALAIGVGALIQQFPMLQSFLDTGIPVLEQLAYALGSVIGNIVSGFISGVSSGVSQLPAMAQQLSLFMTNLMPFINGAKLIDESVLVGVGVLAGAVLALTAAELISGITSFVTGGASFAQLGTDLSAFMTNAMPFITGVTMLDPNMAEGVKSLAAAILVLTGANVLESLTSWFTGGTSLADFGKELAAFGPYMAQYAESVAGIDPTTVEASANAAKALAEMASSLPNSGGVVSWFTGENDMDTFGKQLVTFGKSIKEYSLAVSGLDTEAVTASAAAGKSLSELASSLPNSGGVVSWFTGENDMDTFGTQLVSFGTSLKKYSEAVTGLNTEAIATSATAAKSMSDLAAEIPNFGGMVSWFTGDNDLATFGSQLVTFGSSLKNYSDSVAGLAVEPINASVEAARALSKIEGTLRNSGGMASWFAGDNDIGTFGKNIAKFGKSMKEYSDVVSGIDTAKLSSTTKQFNSISEMASSMSGINFDSLGSFGKSLGKLGKDGVDEFIKAFDNAKDRVTKAGEKLVSNFVKGVTSTARNIENAFSKTIAKAISSIKDSYRDFYSAGAYLIEGFARGISANAYKAEAKSRAMAAAAANAAKSELQEHSPSKVGYKIGDFFGVAFVNAIGDYARKAYNAGSEMASYAKTGLSQAIYKIKDFVNGDIDMQPTIRPVLDLSEIESGAGAIDGMLGMRSPITALASAGAIGTMMNQNRQNGVNGDVVSAINKLRKDLSNVGNTSYTINGVTYDDDSVVTDAIRTIVRAARVERRT